MRRIERAVTLLPQPLSPTIPSVRLEHVETGPVDRLDDPVVLEEVGLQVSDPEQRRVVDSGGWSRLALGSKPLPVSSALGTERPPAWHWRRSCPPDHPCGITLRVRIGGVAEAVAEEVESEDDENHRHCRQ